MASLFFNDNTSPELLTRAQNWVQRSPASLSVKEIPWAANGISAELLMIYVSYIYNIDSQLQSHWQGRTGIDKACMHLIRVLLNAQNVVSSSLILTSLVSFKEPKNIALTTGLTSASNTSGKGAKKTNKCQFWPYIHTYSIKTNILCFFSQATIGKNIKKTYKN